MHKTKLSVAQRSPESWLANRKSSFRFVRAPNSLGMGPVQEIQRRKETSCLIYPDLLLTHSCVSGRWVIFIFSPAKFLAKFMRALFAAGPIPPELENLAQLENLYLWRNQLSGEVCMCSNFRMKLADAWVSRCSRKVLDKSVKLFAFSAILLAQDPSPRSWEPSRTWRGFFRPSTSFQVSTGSRIISANVKTCMNPRTRALGSP